LIGIDVDQNTSGLNQVKAVKLSEGILEMRLIWALFYWNKQLTLNKDAFVIMFAFLGGWACSHTHISVGWMLGSLFASGILRLFSPVLIPQSITLTSIHPFWRQFGQMLLAIQIAKQLNFTMLHAFEHSWISILILLTFSILLSLGSGMILWKYTQSDLLSCLYGTAPGGVSAMPSIASEVGANSVIVTVTQIIRNLFVVTLVPMITTSLYGHSAVHLSYAKRTGIVHTFDSSFHATVVIWTVVLLSAAYTGYRVWRLYSLPAPALVGSMVGAAFVQGLTQWITNVPITPYWPEWIMILSQVAIGTSIGSRIDRDMFLGSQKILWIGGLCSLIYILIMLACSIAFANWIGVGVTTSILAFAPGGVAEMALTATGVQADAPIVLTVQTLRLCLVLIILPPIFRLLNKRLTRQ
jgi:uncharacterized protein